MEAGGKIMSKPSTFRKLTVDISTAPEINVEKLMQRIKEELARAGASGAAPPLALATSANADLGELAAALSNIVSGVRPPPLMRLSLSEPKYTSKQVPAAIAPGCDIHWRDLVTNDGDAFVRAAYGAILGREADVDGLTCYRTMLRDGASKVEVLGRICDSQEAKQRNASLVGLALPYAFDKVRRWPVLGRLVSIVVALWNLPDNERHYRQLSCELVDRLEQCERDWGRVGAEIYDALRALERAQNSFGDLTRLLASRNQVDAILQVLTKITASIQAMQVGVRP
jgi:hypothetical protein